MPFPFTTSTTSHLTFQSCLTSSTHPSLPSVTTAHRNVLRAALKSHKRLRPVDQLNHLTELTSCLTIYLRYLLSIDLALGGRSVAGEDVDLALVQDIDVEWRPTLVSTNIPGRDADRVRGQGLDYELYFVHHSYAEVQSLVARQALLTLYTSGSLSTEQRSSAVQTALKCLKVSHSIHSYLVQRANSADGFPLFPPPAVDIALSTQQALQHLAHAEVDLLCVLKDDPYPAILAQSRDQDDKEWMIKAPEIPKTRTQVLTRLCIGAAEHAATAGANLKAEGQRINRELVEYANDLRMASRARACRFQALDCDSRGQTGDGIAWLRAAMGELGVEVARDGAKAKGLSRLKASWTEKREDRRVEKGSQRWGTDGGKMEESRIVDYLARKMTKANDTISFQLVPEWKPLLNRLPSGMNMPIDEKWQPPTLTEDELAAMRAPPDEDSRLENSSEDEEGLQQTKPVAGAFPDTNDDRSVYY